MPFPPHVPEQIAISQTKRDEIAATAMIGAEHQFSRLQFFKGIFDIACPKAGAVAPDDDEFVVAKFINFLDCIFEPCREVAACLPVNLRSRWDGTTAGSKKMHIDPMRKFGTKRRKI